MAVLLMLPLLMGGCAKNINPNEYSENEVGAVKQTYKGVVISVRPVKVQGSDKLSDNTLGAVGGGVAGGLLGSQIGQGSGSVVGLVVGAAAGALGGSLLEKGLKSQDGIEYTVELQSGRIMTIVQGPESTLSVGQHVLVMVGYNGRSRVIPDQMAMQRAQEAQVVYQPAPRPAPRPAAQRPVRVKKVAQPSTPQGRSVDDIDYTSRDRYARDQQDLD